MQQTPSRGCRLDEEHMSASPSSSAAQSSHAAYLFSGRCGGSVVDRSQQREEHLPEALLPHAVAEPRSLAGHHREKRPHSTVPHLWPCVSAQPLCAAISAQQTITYCLYTAGTLTCHACAHDQTTTERAVDGSTQLIPLYTGWVEP